MKKVILTGATGNVGKPLLTKLLAKGAKVTALVRDPAKIEPHENITLVKADLENPETYAAYVANHDVAFILTPGVPNMVQMQTDFIQACVKAGVGFVLKQSALGVGTYQQVKMFQWHQEIEDRLEKAPINHCIIQPSPFTQNLLAHANSIQEQGAIYAPAGDGKVSYIDSSNIAEAAASILMDAENHTGKTYQLTGPEAYSMVDVASVIGKLIDKEVNFVGVTPEQGREALLSFGLEEWLVDDLTAIAVLNAEGKGDTITSALPYITGHKGKTIEETLSQLKIVFTQASNGGW